jgi:hypothetical protein
MGDDFELLDSLSDIEVIAVNVSIRELKKLKKQFGAGAGANSKELVRSSSRMVRFTRLNCIGTKPTASGSES